MLSKNNLKHLSETYWCCIITMSTHILVYFDSSHILLSKHLSRMGVRNIFGCGTGKLTKVEGHSLLYKTLKDSLQSCFGCHSLSWALLLITLYFFPQCMWSEGAVRMSLLIDTGWILSNEYERMLNWCTFTHHLLWSVLAGGANKGGGVYACHTSYAKQAAIRHSGTLS